MQKEHPYLTLTEEKKVNILGVELFRIKATKTFTHKYAGVIKEGTKGGFVKSLNVLKNFEGMYGNAWVSGDAEVYGNARVYGDAWVYGNARVYGDAEVYGNARVYGDAEVYGNARVYGDAEVYGKVKLEDTILCSKLNFEFSWQVDLWLKMEKDYQEEVEKKLKVTK